MSRASSATIFFKRAFPFSGSLKRFASLELFAPFSHASNHLG